MRSPWWKVANADDVAKVQEIFQARIDTQIEGRCFLSSYGGSLAESVEIVTWGNYVALFVGAEKDQMVEAFNAAGQSEAQ